MRQIPVAIVAGITFMWLISVSGKSHAQAVVTYSTAADFAADSTPDGQLIGDSGFKADYAGDADSDPSTTLAVAQQESYTVDQVDPGQPAYIAHDPGPGDWGPTIDYGQGFDPLTGLPSFDDGSGYVPFEGGYDYNPYSDGSDSQGDYVMENLTVDQLASKVADQLRPLESFKPFIYDDKNGQPWRTSQAGNPTIGYGHLLTRDYARANPDYTVGITEANNLLMLDIKNNLSPIAPYLLRPLTENEWIALGILAYNIGPGKPGSGKGVLGGSLINLINSDDDETLEGVWKSYNKATVVIGGQKQLVEVNGLNNRRNAEWSLWAQSDSPLVALA